MKRPNAARTTRKGNGVATESTNADDKSGSGRMVFFVLIAIAVVLFILGVTDSYTQDGPNIHPMDQFIVSRCFGDGPVHWYTPTNVTLWMALAVAAVAALMVMGTGGRAVIPSRSQSMAELAYGFVRKMVEDVAGKDALPFFPYIFTLFLFILMANFLGLIPMSFTTTSHIAVTAILAAAVFITVTLVGFIKNGAGFLSLFWVSSAPLALRPDPRHHRDHLVLRAARQPLHPSCRQPDGRPRGSEGVRGLRRGHGPGGHRADPRRRRDLRARGAGVGHPGLRLHHPHLRVPEGRAASASLTVGGRPTLRNPELPT
jgi:hypothetical protein